MLFRYGSFSFASGECMVEFFGQFRRYNGRGLAQTVVKRMNVSGEIVADGQSAINTRAALIQNAMSLDGGSAAFLKSDGSETIYKIDGGSARSVRVLDFAFLQQDGKAHFATGLPFQFTIEGEFTLSDGDPLVSYEERITRIGLGGPRKAWPELINGQSIEQTTSYSSNITIVQSGDAIGSLGYPAFNQPIFPDALGSPEDYQTTTGTPRRDGFSYVDWPISWSYRMTLVAPQNIPYPLIR